MMLRHWIGLGSNGKFITKFWVWSLGLCSTQPNQVKQWHVVIRRHGCCIQQFHTNHLMVKKLVQYLHAVLHLPTIPVLGVLCTNVISIESQRCSQHELYLTCKRFSRGLHMLQQGLNVSASSKVLVFISQRYLHHILWYHYWTEIL